MSGAIHAVEPKLPRLDGPARHNELEAAAKRAYGVYAHRAGVDVPYERLSNEQRQAWREVIEFLEDQLDCSVHGQPLVCPDCMRDQGDMPECLECGGEMICPSCKAEERKLRKAERAARKKALLFQTGRPS